MCAFFLHAIFRLSFPFSIASSSATTPPQQPLLPHHQKDEAQYDNLRCRRARGVTHSVSSLHLGFVDAGFCDGKLVFSKVSPHDYTEGQMSAPMGAQVGTKESGGDK